MKFDLNVIIPNPNVRKWIYGIYGVLVIAAGAIGAAYEAVNETNPAWLLQANSVLGYLGLVVVGLAVANTPAKEVKDENTAEAIAQRIEQQ